MEQTHTGLQRRPRELGQRARTFDKMADSWSRLRARERREVHLRRQHAEIEAQNRGLQEVNRRKTAVVSHVSHELRSPLTAIIGSRELVLEGEAGPLASQRELLDLMPRSLSVVTCSLEEPSKHPVSTPVSAAPSEGRRAAKRSLTGRQSASGKDRPYKFCRHLMPLRLTLLASWE